MLSGLFFFNRFEGPERPLYVQNGTPSDGNRTLRGARLQVIDNAEDRIEIFLMLV